MFHFIGNALFVTKFFNNFWHLNPRIFEHENSEIYKECIKKWKEFAIRLQLQQTINKNMQKHIDDERKKLKAILESVVDVILFLSKLNLSFRGHREAFESNKQGNFLGTVKPLAKYSPVLSKHVSDICISKKRTTTYFSPTIQNKLVLLLSKKVKNIIFQELREAKYFAIMYDGTPDISHTDEMTLVVVVSKVSTPGQRQTGLGFILLLPQTAALSESNAGSGVIKPASGFVIQNRQTSCSMW